MKKRLVLQVYLEWGMYCVCVLFCFSIQSENGSLNFAEKLVPLIVCLDPFCSQSPLPITISAVGLALLDKTSTTYVCP